MIFFVVACRVRCYGLQRVMTLNGCCPFFCMDDDTLRSATFMICAFAAIGPPGRDCINSPAPVGLWVSFASGAVAMGVYAGFVFSTTGWCGRARTIVAGGMGALICAAPSSNKTGGRVAFGVSVVLGAAVGGASCILFC